PAPDILDVGCATGMSSIELAKISNGYIVSLDKNPTYLEILKRKAEAQNVSERIKILKQDLFTMTFNEDAFDVIWAENIIFALGIRGALKAWRRFLKKGGYLVFSIIARLRDEVPEEAREYWERVYPGVKTDMEIKSLIEKERYVNIDSILIPTSESMKYCYIPLQRKIRQLREKYGANKEYIAYLDMNQEEIDIVRKYGSEFYGSIFYIARRSAR
ncbi:MAG: class I SAM-dependent methyltransferase, partial [Candidatus Thorarchaeota archaeon]|nr:class I SAM-dependent methyltransferase [Candidatus Thorarchaeota archaeon]